MDRLVPMITTYAAVVGHAARGMRGSARRTEPRTPDAAYPVFLPERHARAAAERYCDRLGLPRPRWAVRERMTRKERHAKREGIRPQFTADELAEVRAWAPEYATSRKWVRAVRYLREHRRRAGYLVGLRKVIWP
jgi:hypothetical protein